MVAMLGVASSRVVRSFEIQVAKARNGQKNGSAEESNSEFKSFHRFQSFKVGILRVVIFVAAQESILNRKLRKLNTLYPSLVD